jgi:peptidoglycan hydrolase-like protein with peptidoglycan-binding domain
VQAGRTTLTAQQQTTIQQSVLSARNAPRVSNVNFALNVGAVIPTRFNAARVSAFPVLLDVFPRFRDFSFFVVEDEIVFLDPGRRVVDIVPAGPRARFSSSGPPAGLNLGQAEIREVQQVLISRGLLTGEPDGVLSARTKEALIAFQRQQGLQATGSIDVQTVSALGLSERFGQGASTTGQGPAGPQQPGAQQNMGGAPNAQPNNAPLPQNQSTSGQGQAGQGQTGTQQPAPQNQTTTGQGPAGAQPQAAPQGQSTTGQGQTGAQPPAQNQSTTGQGMDQPNVNQNVQPGSANQGGNSPPAAPGNAQPPAQNPQNPNQNMPNR